MSIKIMLDAGHYGKNNRSKANADYYESEMNWKLHLLLKMYLEDYGFEVFTTRSDQKKDLEVYERGKLSEGCALFLSIHSNAVSGGVNEKFDRPMVYVQLDGKGDALGQLLANCITRVMETAQAGKIATRKGNRGEYYGVLRGAAAVGTVGIILEHSYHTNTRSTNWLLDDENLDRMARAEAAVIAEYYGLLKVDPNGDGKLDIADVTALTDHLSRNDDYRTEMDVNGDGLNNIADLTKLQDILSGREEEKTVTVTLPVLKKGDKRAEVKTVQLLLNALGYEDSSGKALVTDGSFGGKTMEAVKNFQKSNGLEEDGIVDKDCWEAILKGG